MAIIEVGIQLIPNGSGRAIANWNNIEGPTVTGPKSSDLIETSAGGSTGYTLTLNGPFAAAVENINAATSSPDARFPVNFFQGYWYVGLADDDAATFTLGNLPVGATYTIEAASANGRTDRPTTFSATGSSPASATYTPVANIDPVPQPVSLTGTVPAGGEVVLSNIGSSTFAYNNGWLLTIDTGATTPTITDINTNNEVIPGESSTLTGTNLTNATGVNIGSVSQADFTVVNDTTVTFTGTRGGNPYNQDLTATLLSPDGNATITVQQVPATGFAVTAASPNTTDDASLWTGLIDTATSNPVTVVDGDQALVKTSLDGLSITPDGTITASETGSFTVQFWRASEGVWGTDQTVSFTLPSAVSVTIPRRIGIRSAVRSAVTRPAHSSVYRRA